MTMVNQDGSWRDAGGSLERFQIPDYSDPAGRSKRILGHPGAEAGL